MNEIEFENNVKKVMAPEPELSSLSSKIDEIIGRAGNQTRRKHTSVALSSIAAVALLFFLISIVQARSVLDQMAGALDDVTAVRMQSYSITEDGKAVPLIKIDYDHGKWRIEKSAGGETQLYLNGKLYRYDSVTASYVTEERPDGPFAFNSKGLALSSMIAMMKLWGDEITVTDGVLDGKTVAVATITTRSAPTKSVMYADKATMLPIKSEGFSLERNNWRLTTVQSFDYAPKFAPDNFEMRPGVPTVTKAEYEQRLVAAMTSQTLASAASRKNTFLLRSVDVAQDGTVFVAYQIGDKSRTWRGYRLYLTDDLGNEYAAPSESMSVEEDPFLKYSKDGRLEREIFVPLDPTLPWRPHTIKIGARFTSDNEMIRFIGGFGNRVDGSSWFTVMPNTTGVDPNHLPPVRVLWTGRFDTPTCELRPSYLTRLDYPNFNNDVVSRMFRSTTLARHFQNYQNWPSAKKWLEEDLRLKREHERQGYGKWSLDDDLTQLDAVNAHLGKG